MVSASFVADGEFLKALVNAMNVVSTEYIEFRRNEVGVVAADPSRVMVLNVRITPPDYMCDVDSVWVESKQLENVAKKLGKKENYKVEVRDSKFYIGHFEVGNVVEEEDLYSVKDDKKALANLEKTTSEGHLKVEATAFRRIVKSAEAVRIGEWLRDSYDYVGIKVEGRKGAIVFYLNKDQFSAPIDLQTFPDWLIDSGGSAIAVYKLDLFSSMLLLGLADTVALNIRTGKVLQIGYTGRYWLVDFWVGSFGEEEAVEVLEAILAKPKPVRSMAWRMRGNELKDFVNVMKAIAAVVYGDVNIGVSGDELLVYWQNGATCVFQMPKHFFEEFNPAQKLIGKIGVSEFTRFLKNVEDLKCYLQGEPAESLVFVGSGEKIATKEFKSEELVKTVVVPDIGGNLIFSGETKVLQSVFEDALVAEDDFLIFMASGFEITAVGKNGVYYTATLPLDGFQIQSEDYVATTQLEPLKNFFSYIPAYKVSLGKDGNNITVETETTIGSLKAKLVQIAEDLKAALEAYEEYHKAPTAPPEVKPLVEPTIKKELTLEQIWNASDPGSRKAMLGSAGYPYADIDITVQKDWKDLEPAERNAIQKAWETLPEGEEEKPPVVGKPLTEEDVLSVIPFREQGVTTFNQMIEDLKKEGFDLGVEERKLRATLNQLVRKGTVFEPRPDFYSWTISEEEVGKEAPAKPEPKFVKGQQVIFRGEVFTVLSREFDEGVWRYKLQEKPHWLMPAESEIEPAPTEEVKEVAEEEPIPEEPEQTVYVKVHVEGGVESDKEGKPRVVTPEFVLMATTYEEFEKHGGTWEADMWSRPIVGMYGVKQLERILGEAEIVYDAIEDNQLTWGNDWAAIRESLAGNPSPFNKYARFIIKWRPEDLAWTESAKQAWDIYKYKYTREELAGKSKQALRVIAKIKDLSTSGEVEDLIGTIVAAGAYAEEIKAAEEEVPEWAIVSPTPTEAPAYREGEKVRRFESNLTQTITKKQWSPEDKEWFYQLDNEDRWWREKSLRKPPTGRTIWIYNPTYGSLQEKSLEATLPEEEVWEQSYVAWGRPLKDSEKYELLEKGKMGAYPEEFFLVDPRFNLDMDLIQLHKRQVEAFDAENAQGEAYEWYDTEGNRQEKIAVSFVTGPEVDIINNFPDAEAEQMLLDTMVSGARSKYAKTKKFQEACSLHARKLIYAVRSVASYPTLKEKFPWVRKREVKPEAEKLAEEALKELAEEALEELGGL